MSIYDSYKYKILQMKIALVIALMYFVTLTSQGQPEPSEVPGGFLELDLDLSSPLQNTKDHSFADIQNFIRSELSTKSYLQGRSIGKVIRVDLQVVEGLNYRFTFENENGQKLQAIVYERPWTNTRKLTRLIPFLTQEM